MANILEVKDFSVSFKTYAGEVQAVRGVDFSVSEGEIVAIVGESGSGKSVSVNALMGLVAEPGRVTGGSITFDGRDVLAMTKKQLRSLRGKEIGMVFQDPMTSLNPVFTVGNQLMETLLLHTDMSKAEAYKRSVESLAMVGISNPERRMKQYPYEFSGGMRQRAMIAMTLLCQPKLLIADEPTTALDVTIQAQILELMKDLKRVINSSIILITHDLGIISDLCDEVIVMYAGRVAEQGSIDDIFYRTAHPYTSGLLKCLPRLDSDGSEPLIPIEGTPVDLIALPKGCAFASRCNHCMKVCIEHQPPLAEVGEGHVSACWLHALEEDNA